MHDADFRLLLLRNITTYNLSDDIVFQKALLRQLGCDSCVELL